MESVKSAQRTLDILDLMTAQGKPLTFTAMLELLGLPRSSLHGLLATLTDSGWLKYNENTHTYTLGIHALEAGNAYSRSFDLPTRARPLMTAVRDQIDETVQLSVLDGRFNVYVAKVDGGHALRLASEVGRRLPAHATGLGKALLAHLPGPELDELFASVRLETFTAKTIATRDQLSAALARVRSVGYAADNEEYSIGVRCVAVPVRDQSGAVVAALSVSAPTIRFDRTLRSEALQLLLRAAAELSEDLGYDRRGPVGARTERPPALRR